jgi:hypothetical protein
MSQVERKWLLLHHQFQSKSEMKIEEVATIKSLLQHNDIEYVRQGMMLLLSTGVEQICHVLYCTEGFLSISKEFQYHRQLPKAILEQIPLHPKLQEFYDLGAFWKILADVSFSEIPEGLQQPIIDRSKEMALVSEYMEDSAKVGFLVGKYHVTEALWEFVTENRPYGTSGATMPQTGICWLDALAFCNKLSKMEGLEPAYPHLGYYFGYEFDSGSMADVEIRSFCNVEMDEDANGYRLLTESEWEEMVFDASNANDVDQIAWYQENSGGRIQPVGLKKPNSFGIFDTFGNIQTFLWDWDYPLFWGMNDDYYDEDEEPVEPEPPLDCRVIIGSCARTKLADIHNNHRTLWGAGGIGDVGLRICRKVFL